MCCVLKYSIFSGECFNDADCSSSSFPVCNSQGFCGKFSFEVFKKQCDFIIYLDTKIPLKNLFVQTNTAHCLNNEYVCDYYKNCMVKDLVLTGDYAITWPSGTKIIAGTYDGSVANLIQVVKTAAGQYWLSISKEAV